MESDPLSEIADNFLLMRTRHLSRTIGALYLAALNPFGVSAAQFVLLMNIHQHRGASRVQIARIGTGRPDTQHTRLMASGWVQEAGSHPHCRISQLLVTHAGEDLLRGPVSAWRQAQRDAIRTLGRGAAAVIATTADRLMQESSP